MFKVESKCSITNQNDMMEEQSISRDDSMGCSKGVVNNQVKLISSLSSALFFVVVFNVFSLMSY